jgi:hypothetical protein
MLEELLPNPPSAAVEPVVPVEPVLPVVPVVPVEPVLPVVPVLAAPSMLITLVNAALVICALYVPMML